MSKPRLLDLFCGAGGAAVGYHRAGFEVVGIDIRPQPHFPFEFVQADVTEFGTLNCEGFNAIHASPPCQAHTPMSNRWRGKGGVADARENLIPATRELLRETGLPYVIENVVGAPLESPVRLCGMSLGLGAHRHRLFEANFLLMAAPCAYGDLPSAAVYGKLDGRLLRIRKNGSELRAATLEQGSAALGIDWMDAETLVQAVPPAMTELIGHQLAQHIRATATA